MAQWLSDRLEIQGVWFKTHCVVSLSKTLYSLLSAASIQEKLIHDGKIVD